MESDTTLTELKDVPSLNWHQRETLDKHVEIIQARTKYLEALGSVDKETLKLQVQRERHWTDKLPVWGTAWLVYLTAWIFLLMTFRSNVWPTEAH